MHHMQEIAQDEVVSVYGKGHVKLTIASSIVPLHLQQP